jgi:hypothetical protein
MILLLFFLRKQRLTDKRRPMTTEISPTFISLGVLRLVFLFDYVCVPPTQFVPHFHVIYFDVFSFLCLLFLMLLLFSFYLSQ